MFVIIFAEGKEDGIRGWKNEVREGCDGATWKGKGLRKKEVVENKQGIELVHSSRSAISASPEKADHPNSELQ